MRTKDQIGNLFQPSSSGNDKSWVTGFWNWVGRLEGIKVGLPLPLMEEFNGGEELLLKDCCPSDGGLLMNG